MINITFNSKKDLRQPIGKHCFVYRGEQLKHFQEKYGRENICLKVFYDQDKPLNWGDERKGEKRNSTLPEATQIQNICAWHDLAPRVYGLEQVKLTGWIRNRKDVKDKLCDVQITEDMGGGRGKANDSKEVYDKILKLGVEYGWKVNYREYGTRDLIGGKFVDFQSVNLTKDYPEIIKDKVRELGKWGKTHYQAVPELGLTKFRKTEARYGDLGLDKIDFKGKTVMDVGCSSGVFCNYAAKQGAKRVYGVDFPKCAEASMLLANYIGNYNNTYIGIDLRNETPDVPQVDIVFYLSMLFHIGYPKFLKEKCKELMIVEWNHWKKRKGLTPKECENKTWEILKKDYKEVVRFGRCSDHGNKIIFHCKK